MSAAKIHEQQYVALSVETRLSGLLNPVVALRLISALLWNQNAVVDKLMSGVYSLLWVSIHIGEQNDEAAVAEWYRYRTVACFVTGSSPVPLKTRRVGQRCTLNLSRAETSSRWCGVVVRRGGCQLRCRPRHLTMVQNYVVRRQKPSCS
ncbi:uncharacterized protein TNCV_1698141 [Trichonephila clavipes]|nr:uncharacterized protein TNCV_1698141 [Trichonephila clavipes]